MYGTGQPQHMVATMEQGKTDNRLESSFRKSSKLQGGKQGEVDHLGLRSSVSCQRRGAK